MKEEQNKTKSDAVVESNYDQNKDVVSVGHWTQMTKTFGKEQVKAFAGLSEDFNPLHLDEEFAKTTQFKRCIVHGQLFSSLISGILGNHLPGHSSIFMNQTVKYVSPVFVGDCVQMRIEVVNVRNDKPIITLSTTANNLTTGKVAMTGTAMVMYPRQKDKIQRQNLSSKFQSKL